MAEEILKGSGISQKYEMNIWIASCKLNSNTPVIFSISKDDFCSFCGIEDLPTTAVDAVWVRLNDELFRFQE